ncbi:hypothetical protein Harreka1_26 [Olleya phage Harreka_1]|uniref:Uncharacterized protein n=1 Tax=Olleya phage Harreka_1 TaxID=2745673 RepID=A0A8E4ZC05_9CAUD|nr:hypothetical protein M1M26_gp26 [Olleya phage Harreka_1]QQV90433.1 hypothetical protein Harreka1_26 [Olleya phage Harreka_1]
MSKAVLKTVTDYFGEDYGDGCSMSGESISLTFKDESFSYEVSEGEPEDMRFGRYLEDTHSIYKMVMLAYELGKKGIEILCLDEEDRDED